MTEENKEEQNAEEKKEFWIDEGKVIMNDSSVMGITRFDNLTLNGYEEFSFSDFVIHEEVYKHNKHMDKSGYASDLIDIGLSSLLSFIHAKRITRKSSYFHDVKVLFRADFPIVIVCDEIALMVAPRLRSD